MKVQLAKVMARIWRRVHQALIIVVAGGIVNELLGVGRAYADAPPPPNPGIYSLEDLHNTLCGIAKWISGFFFVFAVLAALIAAYQYVTSGGDAEKVKKASKSLTYTAIAVGIAIVSFAVPNVIYSVFGGYYIEGGCSLY